VFFLLAIMAIPTSAVAEATPSLGVARASEFAAFKPQFKQTRSFG
jgi:hypothetical protein